MSAVPRLGYLYRTESKTSFQEKIHFNYIYLRPASPVHSFVLSSYFRKPFRSQTGLVAAKHCYRLWAFALGSLCTGPATNRNFGTRLPFRPSRRVSS